MSFYGNSYYYKLADAFSTVLLKNLGLNRADVTSFPEEFELIESGKKEEIHAESTESNLEICSGNQWIQIGRSKVITNPDTGDRENKFCIMHGPPAKINNQPGFQGIALASGLTSTEVESIDPTKLDYDDIIAVPVIKYDPAGHIVCDEVGSIYYQMPAEPEIELKNRLETIEGRIKNISGSDGTVSNLESVPNEGLINALKTEVENLEESLSEELGSPPDGVDDTNRLTNVENKMKTVDESIATIEEFMETWEEMVENYEALRNEVNNFKNYVASYQNTISGWISTAHPELNNS